MPLEPLVSRLFHVKPVPSPGMTRAQIDALVIAYITASAVPIATETARAEVERILWDVEVRRRSGDLAEINRAYRAQRLAGELTVSYAAFLNAAIVDLVVASAAQDR